MSQILKVMVKQMNLSLTTYLSIDGVHVYVRLLGPLLPKFRVIESNVVPVLRRHKAGLGERGAFAFALNGDGGSSALEDLVDVFFAEATALVVLVHDGSVGSLPEQVLDLLLGELLDLF